MTYNRVHKSRIEDYTGITTTDIIPIGQSRWYENVPGYEGQVVQLTGNDVDTIANLPRLGPPAAVFENPLSSQPLPDGDDLFLGGDKSYVSYRVSEPHYEYGGYAPAKQYVEGVEYTLDEQIFSNLGMYPLFTEYDNEIADATLTYNNATGAIVGTWLEVTDTSAGSDGYGVYTFSSALTGVAYIHCLVQRGDSDKTRLLLVDSVGTNPTVTIDWTTTSIFFAGDSVDRGSSLLSDDIALIRAAVDAPDATYTGVRFIPDSSGTVAGVTAYFKELMVVDAIDYAVPYTQGTHNKDRLEYFFDHRKDTEFTWDGFSVITDDPATAVNNIMVLGDTTETYYIRIAIKIGGQLRLSVSNASGTATVDTTGVVTRSTPFYWKLMYNADKSIDITLDGETVSLAATYVPSLVNLKKILQFGSNGNVTYLDGYMCNVRYSPEADDTTDHYDSGDPWYATEKALAKDAAASVSKSGHLAGLFTSVGTVTRDGPPIDGQNIIQWDTGLMINHANTAPPTYVIAFVGTPTVITDSSTYYFTIGRYK